jgi:PilZ domain-containing protein
VADEDRPDQISAEERRHFDRSRLIVDVHFDGADATGVASTKDISVGGLYMSTQAEIPVGTTLALRLPLGSEHIVVKAEVVYSNPGHGVGVKFNELPETARALMERELPAR